MNSKPAVRSGSINLSQMYFRRPCGNLPFSRAGLQKWSKITLFLKAAMLRAEKMARTATTKCLFSIYLHTHDHMHKACTLMLTSALFLNPNINHLQLCCSAAALNKLNLSHTLGTKPKQICKLLDWKSFKSLCNKRLGFLQEPGTHRL